MDTKLYDNVIKVAIVNLYTLSKDTNKLNLRNLNFKNNAHLCILNIARIAHTLFGIEIYIDTKWYKFFYYKIKYKLNWCKRAKTYFNIYNVDINKFISDIEDVNNFKNIFSEIYLEYYKK